MRQTTEGWDRLASLKALALRIADELDAPDEGHSMAQLARQYRETLREISEMEDGLDDRDEIEAIASRVPHGQAGAG